MEKKGFVSRMFSDVVRRALTEFPEDFDTTETWCIFAGAVVIHFGEESIVLDIAVRCHIK